MKFRGEIEDCNAVGYLTTMVNSASKQHRLVTLRLTEERIYVISSDPSFKFCGSLARNSLFTHYTFEGTSEVDNEIILELGCHFLLRVLRLVNSFTRCVKIRLARSDSPELVFDIVQQRDVTHVIPVLVISRRYWGEIQNLNVPPPDISVAAPHLNLLRTIMERLRTSGEKLTLMVSSDGKLSLAGQEEIIETCFNNLDLLGNRRSEVDKAVVRVDIKRVLSYIYGLQNQNTQIICKISHHRALHLVTLYDDTSTELVLPHALE